MQISGIVILFMFYKLKSIYMYVYKYIYMYISMKMCMINTIKASDTANSDAVATIIILTLTGPGLFQEN